MPGKPPKLLWTVVSVLRRVAITALSLVLANLLSWTGARALGRQWRTQDSGAAGWENLNPDS
jgi:hypothetical protein